MLGKSLTHYEILEKIGEGGMGIVYKARDTRLNRLAALKVLPPDKMADEGRRARFIQEAQAASALSHPNIVTIYEIDRDAGSDFIAMEFIAGRTLDAVISRHGLKLSETLRYAVQVADALCAAHAAGIVHRDLKPGNVMITEKGQVKILDFGLAKLTEAIDLDDAATRTLQPEPLTEQGAVLGTVAYMSPEQAEGKKVDARSDIFSFGSLLYEMVTGRRAFSGDSKMSTITAILRDEPKPLSQAGEVAPRDLEKIIARCLRKDLARRFQHMDDVKIALEELKEESDSGRLEPARPAAGGLAARRRWIPMLAGAALLVAGLAGSAWWWLSTRSSTPAPPPLTRLTSDSGITDAPAISPDGKFVAYVSDRAGEGTLDLWVQQIPGGQPVRLSRGGLEVENPSFSPDGSKIAFRARREETGIYVIPTLGGEPRLLVKDGHVPRFSPDGNWIAYWAPGSPGTRMYVVPAGGGPARQLATDFFQAGFPVWSPDGKYLLFLGQQDPKASLEDRFDWYVIPFEGKQAVRTGGAEFLHTHKFPGFAYPPEAWVAQGDRILFHAHVGDTQNLWQAALNPRTFQFTGTPARATYGTNDEETGSTTPDGRLVYTSRNINADLWTIPLDADQAKPLGAARRLTQDAADDYDVSLSADGKSLVWSSRRAGNFDVFLKDLGTGRERALTQTRERERPAISPDGSRVAYSVRERKEKKTPIFLVAASGGAPERACGDCGGVWRWSSDGTGILYQTPDQPPGIGLWEIASGQKRDLAPRPKSALANPALSPDGRWLAFAALASLASRGRLWIARVTGGAVSAETEWIAAAADGIAPDWSPNGNILYFGSERDGYFCLWAQRLDPAAKKPAGEPLAVFHAHTQSLSARNLNVGQPSLAVARDKLVFNLGEHTGNIWMTQLSKP